jgi:chromosome segregation ATPase
MSDDIVPRLRLWADGFEKQHAVSLAVAIREASDEIELLRAERGTARHGVSRAIETLMHAVDERETLRAELRQAADEIERLRKERDEARRIACAYCLGFKINEVTVDLAEVVLEGNRRGWDCFKENTK